jgi:hypothetical protein
VSFELFQAGVEVVKDFLDEQVKIGPVKSIGNIQESESNL